MRNDDMQDLFYKLRDVLVWHEMSESAREILRDILIDLQDLIDSAEYNGPDLENN